MRLDILTLFPDMVEQALGHSILKRARENSLVEIHITDIRSFTTDKHRSADDAPYGGGGGMLMRIEPIYHALASVGALPNTQPDNCGIIERPRVALTDPRGKIFCQETARQWAAEPHIVLICGHYEGVDERVEHLITNRVSLGDFVLTGGELPALVIADALIRLQPGALGDAHAAHRDSFSEPLLEYPQYTRPALFQNWEVPQILLSGHHAAIAKWQRWHSLHATKKLRPDLFEKLALSAEDQKLLQQNEPAAPSEKRAQHIQQENNHGTGC